jgi:4a-hydroxytetrahydrobiopterin dehydratase
VSRPELLGKEVIVEWLRSHGEWRIENDHLVREIVTPDYPKAVQIVDAQVELCEYLDHHPEVTVGYRTLRFEIWTHDRNGVTQLDLDYAEGLEELLSAHTTDDPT